MDRWCTVQYKSMVALLMIIPLSVMFCTLIFWTLLSGLCQDPSTVSSLFSYGQPWNSCETSVKQLFRFCLFLTSHQTKCLHGSVMEKLLILNCLNFLEERKKTAGSVTHLNRYMCPKSPLRPGDYCRTYSPFAPLSGVLPLDNLWATF